MCVHICSARATAAAAANAGGSAMWTECSHSLAHSNRVPLFFPSRCCVYIHNEYYFRNGLRPEKWQYDMMMIFFSLCSSFHRMGKGHFFSLGSLPLSLSLYQIFYVLSSSSSSSVFFHLRMACCAHFVCSNSLVARILCWRFGFFSMSFFHRCVEFFPQ